MRTNHNIQTGIYRLQHAPRDVYAKHDYAAAQLAYQHASDDYKYLYDSYDRDMRGVFAVASHRWEQAIEELIAGGMTEQQALAKLQRERIAGPAEHPMLTWIIRKYWLACDALNRGRARDWVPGETFILKWYCDAERSDYVALISALPYWPMGMDKAGNWC